MRDFRGKSGFTLLEVMVVLAIILLGFSVLSQLQNSALRQSTEMEEATSIQVICQNRMDRILAGADRVSHGQILPVSGFPDWSMTVYLDPVPLPSLVRVRIAAQKYEETREPSAQNPGRFNVIKRPLAGNRLVIAEWARRASLKISGPTPQIGSLRTPAANPFAAVDQMSQTPLQTAPDPFAVTDYLQGNANLYPSVHLPDGISSDGFNGQIGGLSGMTPPLGGFEGENENPLGNTPSHSLDIPNLSSAERIPGFPEDLPSSELGKSRNP